MLKIFLHTWKVNRWEEVLKEQLNHIEDSGLSELAEVEVCYNDDEGKTLLDIWNFCNNEDSYVLYLQNLGITYHGLNKLENMTAKYRRWVMDGVVGNWKEYVSYLKEFDVVADNFKEEEKDYKKHFAANMWWSKSEYIKTLESPQNLIGDRSGYKGINHEHWPCTNVSGKFKNIRKNNDIEPHRAYKYKQRRGVERF
jgi:hypothetical protein